MAWFGGKVNLGNFPDLAGAVNKLQESVKNIEKNFDTALGFDEKQDSTTEGSGIWPVMSFVGKKGEEGAVSLSEQSDSSWRQVDGVEDKEGGVETQGSVDSVMGKTEPVMEKTEPAKEEDEEVRREIDREPSEEAEAPDAVVSPESGEAESESKSLVVEPVIEDVEASGSVEKDEEEASKEVESSENLQTVETMSESHELYKEGSALEHDGSPKVVDVHDGSPEVVDLHDGLPEVVDEHDGTPKGVDVHDGTPKGVDVHDGTPKGVDLHDGTPKGVGVYGGSPKGVDVLDGSPKGVDLLDGTPKGVDVHESIDKQMIQAEEVVERSSPSSSTPARDSQAVDGLDDSISHSDITKEAKSAAELSNDHISSARPPSDTGSESVSEVVSSEIDTIAKVADTKQLVEDKDTDLKEQRLSSVSSMSDPTGPSIEFEKVKREMKMMEAALQGAARQAQAKADEIARLMTENEQLKSVIEDLKRKPNEAEVESLREEYHQRVATLERKVYALTRERDTLRREQNKKSDAAALLKEKDEIITQVMAEGEELSKKQASQEAQIRKLRAQVREIDEEKKGLITKLQVEENKVESIKKDKAATEKLLQETIEKHQAELAAQKEFYTNALNAAKEAEALAEARANSEARTELESRLREAEEREGMLVQALEELRQTLSRQEQQAAFREDMLRRDIEDLQKRYQASERRCEELVTQVPDSTRPLLRQIEAMQETTARRAEAWAAVERSLNSRLQEAEAKAAAAEERERSINERLSQTLSRINVLEAQISCLRAEQTQLTRSLEKERQRAAENRQEYLVAKEEADTQEGRVSQLEEEIRELKRKHKQELQEALMHREHLEQEIEREKAARLELERTARIQSTAVSDQTSISRHNSAFENGNLTRRLSSASSLGSMEESYYLQASLDSSDTISERRNPGEPTMSPYYMKSMTPSAFEAALRQKEGELASYMSRLATMESIRDSLAEELVKMTEQCEKLRAEAALLPGIRAELEALRRRHSAALELMGERDEELEELRADIVDLKEMYREQVNLLVNKIQTMNS